MIRQLVAVRYEGHAQCTTVQHPSTMHACVHEQKWTRTRTHAPWSDSSWPLSGIRPHPMPHPSQIRCPVAERSRNRRRETASAPTHTICHHLFNTSCLVPTPSLSPSPSPSHPHTVTTMSNPGQGFEYPPSAVTWLKRDALLFANSIGATAQDELHFLYVGVFYGTAADPCRSCTPTSRCSPPTPSSCVSGAGRRASVASRLPDARDTGSSHALSWGVPSIDHKLTFPRQPSRRLPRM